MLIEVIRAVLCMFFLLIGIMAVMRSDWRLTPIAAGLFIVSVMAGEVLFAVNAASTHVSDLGEVRKVGWLTILAAIIAVWRGPRWVRSS